ncbi:DUF1003 domain-containing protein [Chryseobacterium sp. W4I1]|uniref:DUF1003 domain-containing protein n=1 Tax=Chryseobacterium sp. W4I1 TaxID=3042293 RepID=UPI0027894CE9|nr:DUF1003 domain-containing protein [Chryseobacterium sp. W4I1]MDQ0780796.1 putative membrane protein [Chryseobacterium sp. W4I1]
MKKENEKTEVLEKIANGITWWVGSIPSLIVHTLFFITSFLLPMLHIVEFDKMLLILTTVVSLEAIYLAIFIQMSVNKSHEKIEDIQEDIEDIQEDIEEISEDIEEISEDIEEINEDIEDIQEDIEEINEDEDDEDHNERAKNVILKSNVSSNKNEIKALKDIISQLQNEIDLLKKDE